MTEATIQATILAYLRLAGHHAFKTGAGLIQTRDGRRISMGSAGQADLVCAIHERDQWIWGCIEVKLPTGRLSYKQILKMREHHAAKRRFLVACEVDDVVKWLSNPDYHGPDNITRSIFDSSYTPPEPKARSYVKSPTWFDDLKIQREAERLEHEKSLGSPPF